MATGNINSTNSNGVNYDLIYTGGITPFYDLTITFPGGGTTVVNGIPAANVLGTSGGELTLLNVLGSSTYVIPPGVSGTVDVAVAVAGGNTVYVGGSAIIATNVSALSGLTVNVDGGSATASAGSLLSTLGGTTINIDNGGTFGNGSALASVLNGATINFGTSGGTFIANAGGALIDLSSTIINGFDATSDKIEFQNLPASVNHYSIVDTGPNQVIALFDSGNSEIGSVEVGGHDFATGTTDYGQSGPLTIDISGSNVFIDPGTAVLCFLAGTLIATATGDIAVEKLRVGDLVLTADDREVPVRWLGVRTVSTVFADPLITHPVRVRAGALGPNLPVRDLLVSPDHALLIDNCLIQAGALVNGRSVVRETPREQRFKYYHVEISEHALILAEGVAAETFVDNVSRAAFDNWAEYLELCQAESSLQEMEFPRAKSARQIPYETRAKLALLADGCELPTRSAA